MKVEVGRVKLFRTAVRGGGEKKCADSWYTESCV